MGNLESTDGGPGEPPSVPLLLPPGKTPMPEPCELEERFALVLSSMNLPPDKARLLRQYDNEKKLDAKTPSQRNKWQQQELIAELRRRQAKEHRPVYEGKDGTIEDIITGFNHQRMVVHSQVRSAVPPSGPPRAPGPH